jgi:hypothetical protein
MFGHRATHMWVQVGDGGDASIKGDALRSRGASLREDYLNQVRRDFLSRPAL